MRIGIIGGGAIGLLIGSYISSQHSVTLYVNRLEQKELIQKEEINRYVHAAHCHKADVQVELITNLKAEECFIVCVKQAGIQAVLSVLETINTHTPVIFTQNGMAHIAHLQKVRYPTFIGIVEHGAVKLSDNQVNHLGNGQIKLARITGSSIVLNELTNQLNRDEFKFSLEKDPMQVMKDKLIVNAVINPLTALFDVPNKAINQDEHINALAKKLSEEAALVLGLSITDAWDKVQRIAAETGENTSSMRADMLDKRKTEIHAISGYLLQQAKTELPFTEFVYRAILTLETR